MILRAEYVLPDVGQIPRIWIRIPQEVGIDGNTYPTPGNFEWKGLLFTGNYYTVLALSVQLRAHALTFMFRIPARLVCDS